MPLTAGEPLPDLLGIERGLDSLHLPANAADAVEELGFATDRVHSVSCDP